MKTTHKIQTNRGKRRIWLDGPRLAGAGFIGGSHYILTRFKGLIITPAEGHGDLAENQKVRKVTGRPDGKPIIDMIGKVVGENFDADVTHVDVHWTAGRITIKAAK